MRERVRATKKLKEVATKTSKQGAFKVDPYQFFFRRIITPLKKGFIHSIYTDRLGAHLVTNFKNLQESFNTDITSWLVNLNPTEIRV